MISSQRSVVISRSLRFTLRRLGRAPTKSVGPGHRVCQRKERDPPYSCRASRMFLHGESSQRLDPIILLGVTKVHVPHGPGDPGPLLSGQDARA
jgi:hypothetical protein